jgi:hypothetical protein
MMQTLGKVAWWAFLGIVALAAIGFAHEAFAVTEETQYVNSAAGCGGNDGTSGNPYCSCAEWEAQNRNLVTQDKFLTVEFEGSQTDSCTLADWTTDATRAIVLEGLEIATEEYGATLTITVSNVTVKNAELSRNGAYTSTRNIYIYDATNITIERSIIWAGSSFIADAGTGMVAVTPSAGTYTFRNNIMYDCARTCLESVSASGITWNVYNNTAVNANRSAFQIQQDGAGGTTNIKNNICQTVGAGYYCYDLAATTLNTGNNISSDATSPDTDYRSKTISFVDAGADNYHLAAGETDAIDAGADLSATGFSNDYDGDSRTGTWDIGADETGGGGGTTTTTTTSTTTSSTTSTTLFFGDGQLKLYEGFEAAPCGITATFGEAPYIEAAHYTPNTSATTYVSSPAKAGACAAHYYALTGTNEQTPWQIGMAEARMVELFGGIPDEIFLQWSEYFSASYPFASSSQKLIRIGYSNESHPESKKEFTVVTQATNTDVNLQYFCGAWGDDSLCSVDTAEHSDDPHPLNEWVTWWAWVKLNNPGESDGFMRVYKNGVLYLEQTDADLRGTDTRGFNYFWVGGNYSNLLGANLTGSGSRYIDEIKLYDSYPDPPGATTTTSTTTTSTSSTTSTTVPPRPRGPKGGGHRAGGVFGGRR